MLCPCNGNLSKINFTIAKLKTRQEIKSIMRENYTYVISIRIKNNEEVRRTVLTSSAGLLRSRDTSTINLFGRFIRRLNSKNGSDGGNPGERGREGLSQNPSLRGEEKGALVQEGYGVDYRESRGAGGAGEGAASGSRSGSGGWWG